jgi:DNA-binding NarL/FixJ family response regulator
MIRVLIADDHDVVRMGLRLLLEQQDEIGVVGEADNGQAAVELTRRLLPDILITDITMPLMDGNETSRRVRALGVSTQVIMLSMHCDEAIVRVALESGAKGYLVKSSVRADLVPAIYAVSRGETYLSPAVADLLVKRLLEQSNPAHAANSDPVQTLTDREREVLQLIVNGHTNKTMAQALQISPRTVEKHRASVMDKLHAPDLASLIQIAIHTGLTSTHK